MDERTLIRFIRPEKDTEENTTYNYYVSRVRIRSEHCVGFLKGRWSSLRGLRIAINSEQHLQFASLWVTTCILLHTFAMHFEEGQWVSSNQFYKEGEEIMAEERESRQEWLAAREAAADAAEGELELDEEIELLEGKLKREELKKKLFDWL